MDTLQSPPPKPHRVSPADSASPPQGAWQEEESLEVYRRKRTQQPPVDGAPEIVRFIKRHPKTGEEVFETIQPRRDGRREIILLEPVQLCEQQPETLYDDYSLYRMEEYVDASSDVCGGREKPVYYTMEKAEKHGKEKDTRVVGEKQEEVIEECLSPTRELETISFVKESREEYRKDVETSSVRDHGTTRRDVETTSGRERPGATATPFEVCSYHPPMPADDSISQEVLIERSAEPKSEREGSQCGKEDRINGTPLRDRTIYYEREIVQGDRTPDREERHASRQALVDDEIARTNRKVDTVLKEQTGTVPRSRQPSVQSSMGAERRREERRSVEEYRREHKEKSEKYLEPPRMFPDKKDTYPITTMEPGNGRVSQTSDRQTTEYQKYERTAYGPGSRSPSVARSAHTGSIRSAHSPCCRHRYGSREHERSLMEERRVVRDVPIYTERRPSPSPRHEPSPAPRKTYTDQRTPSRERCSPTGGRLGPITETITTERFERIERVRRRFPATAV